MDDKTFGNYKTRIAEAAGSTGYTITRDYDGWGHFSRLVVEFENGYAASLGFGPKHACADGKVRGKLDTWHIGCIMAALPSVELAIRQPDGELMRLRTPYGYADTVIGGAHPAQVYGLIRDVART